MRTGLERRRHPTMFWFYNENQSKIEIHDVEGVFRFFVTYFLSDFSPTTFRNFSVVRVSRAFVFRVFHLHVCCEQEKGRIQRTMIFFFRFIQLEFQGKRLSYLLFYLSRWTVVLSVLKKTAVESPVSRSKTAFGSPVSTKSTETNVDHFWTKSRDTNDDHSFSTNSRPERFCRMN